MKKEQVPVTCTKCGKRVVVEFYQPTILNGVFASVLVFEHPYQATCQCGFTVMPQLVGAQLQIVAAPVPEELGSIPAPPAGLISKIGGR